MNNALDTLRHNRVSRTFLQAFLAVVVAAGTNLVNVSTVKAASVAGIAAVAAFLHKQVDDPA